MKKKKYRLKNNYFNLSTKEVVLDIPVTDNKLDYMDAKNISSPELNAILIWLRGENGICTPHEEPKFKVKKNIPFGYLGLNEDRLEEDPIVIVAIFNNDALSGTDIDYFKAIISNSSDAIEAISKIRDENLCKPDVSPFQPREQDGDVIGGNQEF